MHKNSSSKTTGIEVAKIASRLLKKKTTSKKVKSVSASALAQKVKKGAKKKVKK